MAPYERSRNRERVYEALDGERDYQEHRWGLTQSRGQHTTAEFILYMQDYLTQAQHEVSRNPDPHAGVLATETLRKVVAMGVACLEQNGCPLRKR